MELYERIDKLLLSKKRIVIGIDGPCASGKSTLAEEIKSKYKATVFHMDDYFLPIEMKTKSRMNEVGGNVHYERMIDEIFSCLDSTQLSYRKYNCQSEHLEEEKSVPLSDVIVIEGSYSLRENLRKYYDLKVVLTIDYEFQIERLKKRNSKMLNRFINEWIPLENRYFDETKIYDIEDVIIL